MSCFPTQPEHIVRTKSENNHSQQSPNEQLRINLTVKAEDLYNEMFMVIKEQIKGYIRRWKELPCSWINRIVVKMSVPPSKGDAQIQCN